MIHPDDPGTLEMRLAPPAMSGGDRQKALRRKRKELGIKPVHVSPAERDVLAQALRVFELASASPLPAGVELPALVARLDPQPGLAEVRLSLAVFEGQHKDELAKARREAAALKRRLERALAGDAERKAEVERLRDVVRELQQLAVELGAPIRLPRSPVVVSYGAGTNSTAVLIEMARRGEPVDLITFADTGGERPETYAYLALFSDWLVAHGMPAVTLVKKGGRVETLEQDCLRKRMLPSVAYGFKSCSQKYKGEPQDAFTNNWQPALDAWAAGLKVIKCIGYDADEPQRAKFTEDNKYQWRYPLLEWDMGRDECIEVIRAAGLPLPGKSSCFFCPNSRREEILALPDDLKDRAIALERNADLTTLTGLGRRWRWEDLIASDRDQIPMFDAPTEMPCGCYDG